MNSKLLSLALSLLMAVSSSGAAEQKPAAETKPQTSISSEVNTVTNSSNTEAMRFVKKMGIGINLGNTFEACGDWIAKYSSDVTPSSYETAWGSPVITERMIKGYASAGFKTLRIPVAWSNMMGDNYTINEDYAARVKQVVDWALDSGLYVIVNLHYDNGWLENFPAQKNECMKRYKRIWTQVSEIFKDYDEHLVFEGQNEELGWQSVWNQWAGNKGKAESYALVNEINQTFVDVVRNSGGNNKKRYLLIPGYNTGIETTADKLFKIPDDPAKRL
ncbi:MAG: glycoside hydrolase family 5 protein, partial [Huintestinicola sp.]